MTDWKKIKMNFTQYRRRLLGRDKKNHAVYLQKYKSVAYYYYFWFIITNACF